MLIKPADVLVQGQRLLRYYSFFTLLLSLMLIILDSLDTNNSIVAGNDPTLFLFANTAYIIWSVACYFFPAHDSAHIHNMPSAFSLATSPY